MKRIIELLWRNGNPKKAELSEFRDKIGPGAYANHSKLSYEPWRLLEDAGSNRMRQLTPRGKKFAQGKLRIPRRIERDALSGQWKPARGTDNISIGDV